MIVQIKAKIKFKLEHIKVISTDSSPTPLDLEFFNSKASEGVANSEVKGKILLCKKSSCWKRGGKEIYDKITEELRRKGLNDRINVKKTGCMGRCKSAPNLVVLPGKNRYKCFKEEKINTLIDTHFLSK